MNTETKPETESEQPKDIIVELLSICRQLQELCPESAISEYGKYVSVDVSGYGTLRLGVYFNGECRFHDVKTFAELKQNIEEYDPHSARALRIEQLKAELSRLESEAA